MWNILFLNLIVTYPSTLALGIDFLNDTISRKASTRADKNYLCYSLVLILLPDVHVITLHKTALAKELCQKFGNQIKHLVSGTF